MHAYFTENIFVTLQMAQHNIGSLVVLKPGEQQHIAGIFTERGNRLFLFCSYSKAKNPSFLYAHIFHTTV